MKASRHPASYRDPSGFVFIAEGQVHRAIHHSYAPHYDLLRSSGLYDELVGDGLLVPHEEVSCPEGLEPAPWKVLRPRQIPFLSHPYEWTPGQLREAGLLTLEIQRRALARGLTLKDASAFNVQFDGVRPVFIDTSSFEAYREGEPWVAYHQFCTNFLAPLALAAHRDPRLIGLLQRYPEGIPLDLASRLLPWRARISPGLAVHLNLQARVTRSGKGPSQLVGTPLVSKRSLEAILRNLTGIVARQEPPLTDTPWVAYQETHKYSPDALEAKRRFVVEAAAERSPAMAFDLGANTGQFSRAAAEHGAYVVAVDADWGAAERHFRALRAAGVSRILPLVIDLANPSPNLGWANEERVSWLDRGAADLALALALVHHLAITRNVPLALQADLFHRLARWLVVEWIPKDDPQVQRLLRHRRDCFDDYHQAEFERAFGAHFRVRRSETLAGSRRVLYLMEAT